MLGLLTLMLAIILPLNGEAATFYIDITAGADTNTSTQAQSKTTPWKHVRGMASATSNAAAYVPSPGDVFVFKGGETWTSANWPWTFTTSGSAGNPITYTTDHTWFTGASWSQPTIAGSGAQNSILASGASAAPGASFITINDLFIKDCGTADMASDANYSQKCVIWWNSHDLTVTNMTMTTYVWISWYWVFDLAGTYSNFVFSNNDCSKTSGCLWWATSDPNITLTNLTANNNLVHDFDHALLHGVHGDGLIHMFAGQTTATSSIAHVQTCNNNFFGNFISTDGTGAMTAFLFHEGNVDDWIICNNQFTWTPSQSSMFDSQVVIEADFFGTNIGIYSNTFFNAGVNASSAGIRETGTTTLTIKNNIFSGIQYPLFMENASASFRSDYNLFNNYSSLAWTSAPTLMSLATWRSTNGQDTHSIDGGTLGLTDVTPPTFDLHLLATSSAKGTGLNLTSLGITKLNSDYAGVARPSGATAWDMGAYNFSATDTTPPAAPTGVRISKVWRP